MTDTDLEIRALVSELPHVIQLLDAPADEQRARGYRHTLREICQQPSTWRSTLAGRVARRGLLSRLVAESGVCKVPGASLVLTGSGSSHYVGMCLAPPLQGAWGRTVRALPSGDLLTHLDEIVPADAPCLAVSFGRSGDSPESLAVVDALLARGNVCQLLVTCNPDGRLMRDFQSAHAVVTVLLDERTNDRSLVMTSSFTNMALVGRELEMVLARAPTHRTPYALPGCAEHVIRTGPEALDDVVTDGVARVVYLGGGALYGAAHESALKMLEMTAGRVWTMTESFLGVRHGPMAAIDSDTLIVCFLSADPVRRAYETDLIRELDAKRVGGRRVLVGAAVDPAIVRTGDVVIDWSSEGQPADADACVLHVLVGQWLAFWRCLAEGLHPDAPSEAGVITRVVQPFTVHRRTADAR